MFLWKPLLLLKMNKKIKNAEKRVYNNIQFKSDLEVSCFKKLEQAGLNPSYESETVTVWKGFKPSLSKTYAPSKKRGVYNKDLSLQEGKIRDITYTPDFVVVRGHHKFYFDAKGFPNDVYAYKKKLFIAWMESQKDYECMFFEPHSVRQMTQAIDIINNLDNAEKL